MGTKLANRAKAARVRAGFKRESDAAKAIGCSRPLVIRWENGEADSIGGKYLLAAARAYRVNPAWLSLETADDGFPWDSATPVSLPNEPLSGSEKLTHAVRPDAAMMAAAYQAAVIYGDHVKKVLFFTDARHMEFVCALYELLAQGEGVLPGERHADAMLAFAEQLPQLTGEPTNVVPKQQHRARRR